MRLADSTWPEVAALDREHTLVVAPIAACEQHGRHLPTFTDSILVGAIAERAEQAVGERVLLLPVLWLGASGHHTPFGATVTLGELEHARLLVEIARSMLDDGFRRFFFLNGHGGNIDTLHVALRELQSRYPGRLLAGASYWEIAETEFAAIANGARKLMGHACEFETSMMLALRPELVRSSEIRDDHRRPDESLRGVFLAEDFSQRTTEGCVGSPSSASADSGRRLLHAAVARVVEVLHHLAACPLSPSRRQTAR